MLNLRREKELYTFFFFFQVCVCLFVYLFIPFFSHFYFEFNFVEWNGTRDVMKYYFVLWNFTVTRKVCNV